MTLRLEVANDLRGTLKSWRERFIVGENPGGSLCGLLEVATHDELLIDRVTDEALAGLANQHSYAEVSARNPIVIVTKAPHGCDELATAAILARCIAFGLQPVRVKRITLEDAHRVAQVLYTDAWVYYKAIPRSKAIQGRLRGIFDRAEFRSIFGADYDPSMVKPAAVVLEETGLDADELGEIWREGRGAVSREVLTARYGAEAADLVTGGTPVYDWYRGRWPIGIQRVAPSFFAFALRHERLYDGRPTIVLNGQFLLLSTLFAGGPGPDDVPTAMALRVPDDGPTILQVRQWLIGDHDNPAECHPGTIRNDAWRQSFPLAGSNPVTPWSNVVHCSDGYLAGLIETMGLFDSPPLGSLHDHLLQAGYSQEELRNFVYADPVIRSADDLGRLTRLTKGADLAPACAVIETFVPPTFGPANGWGGGLSINRFVAAQSALVDDPTRRDLRSTSRQRPLTSPPTALADLHTAGAGREAVLAGHVALAVPAAGTGGRFGGYDLPEGHPGRMKALAPLFDVGGHRVSALDIRMADVNYWRSLGARINVAMTYSTSSQRAITRWAAGHAASDVRLLHQPDMFRWSLDKITQGQVFHNGGGADDFILRDDGGRPVRKPAGSIGLIAALMLSGELSRWCETGVRYVGVANASDVGARLEPAVVGYLATHHDVDAVVVVVPPPYTGALADDRHIWCDSSGWTIESDGRMLTIAEPHLLDGRPTATTRVTPTGQSVELHGPLGGWLVETESAPGCWSVCVAERPEIPVGHPWFNTNQIYFRLDSLLRLVDHDPGDPVKVRALRDRLTVHVERKCVTTSGRGQWAAQLFQPISSLLEILPRTVPLTMSRANPTGQRTSFAPIKEPRDVLLANAVINSVGTNTSLMLQ